MCYIVLLIQIEEKNGKSYGSPFYSDHLRVNKYVSLQIYIILDIFFSLSTISTVVILLLEGFH